MIYYLLKLYSRFLLSLYFDKILSSGMDKLNHGKPVILVSNHPSAFTEPIIIVNLVARSLYFMVRGDYFMWWNKWFFKIIHLVPIYRKEDTQGSAQKNQSIFRKTTEYLSENKVICILAEGSTSMQKKPRPIEKGFARMAFAAYESGVTDLQIHTIGNNFSSINRVGGRGVHLCSDPIPVSMFATDYQENPKKAIRKLHLYVSEKFDDLIIDIEDKPNKTELEKFLDFYFLQNRPESMRTIFINSDYPERELEASKVEEIPAYDYPPYTVWTNVGRILTSIFYALYWPLLKLVDFLAKQIPLKIEFMSGLRIFIFMLLFWVYGLLFTFAIFGTGLDWWMYLIGILIQHVIIWVTMYYWYSQKTSPLHPYF